MDDALSDNTARLLAAERAGGNAPPMSVSELSTALKRHVESGFSHVRLRGEISGLKRAASGHVYLSLKDMDAKLDAVMWKGVAGRIAFVPADGIEVIATGKLTIYPGRSSYQLVIDSLEIAGEGALLALLEKTKARLAAEGLFDPAKKRRLPFLPRTIGVVTSPTGAVIRDILHRLADRCPCHVIVWPVLVQGHTAAAQIAAAIEGFSAMPEATRPDVVIVARGGGSIEDLWAFNEEVVVRAVAACRIPLISAVGHETDTTLCDYAADVRAPTPTAAAEHAVPVRADLLAGLGSLQARALRAVTRAQQAAQERLTATARRLPSPDVLLGTQRQRVDDWGDRLRRGLSHRLTRAQADLHRTSAAIRPALLHRMVSAHHQQLGSATQRLTPALLTRKLAQAESHLGQSWRLLQSYHPDKPLERGYARVERQTDQRVISTAKAAQVAQRLTLCFSDGKVDVEVERGQSSPRPAPPPKPSQPKPEQPSLL